MKKLLAIAIFALVASACGSKEEEKKPVELKTFKDKLSYVLGADHARAISESGDPNFSKYDIDQIVEGFKIGIKDEKAFGDDCKATISSLFGATGNEFHKEHAKEGSKCIGKISGIFFATGWKQKKAMDKINMAKVLIGFEEGLRKHDSIVPMQEQMKMVQDFMTDLNKMNGTKLLKEAQEKQNAKVMPSGIVLETIQEGKGGSPVAGGDVLAHYVLMNALGDTLQNSFEIVEKYKQPLRAFSLLEVVAGWQEAFPMMKKGGKYRLYVPFHLAYGEQGMYNQQTGSFDIQPFESLLFYIELLNYGKAGSLTKNNK